MGSLERGLNMTLENFSTEELEKELKYRKTLLEVGKATEIPLEDAGLTINVGRDGTWLHFKAKDGLYASLNVENLAANKGSVTERALLAWCHDRAEIAQKIKDRVP